MKKSNKAFLSAIKIADREIKEWTKFKLLCLKNLANYVPKRDMLTPLTVFATGKKEKESSNKKKLSEKKNAKSQLKNTKKVLEKD